MGFQKRCPRHPILINDLDVFFETSACHPSQKRCPWARKFSEKLSLEASLACVRAPSWNRVVNAIDQACTASRPEPVRLSQPQLSETILMRRFPMMCAPYLRVVRPARRRRLEFTDCSATPLAQATSDCSPLESPAFPILSSPNSIRAIAQFGPYSMAEALRHPRSRMDHRFRERLCLGEA